MDKPKAPAFDMESLANCDHCKAEIEKAADQAPSWVCPEHGPVIFTSYLALIMELRNRLLTADQRIKTALEIFRSDREIRGLKGLTAVAMAEALTSDPKPWELPEPTDLEVAGQQIRDLQGELYLTRLQRDLAQARLQKAITSRELEKFRFCAADWKRQKDLSISEQVQFDAVTSMVEDLSVQLQEHDQQIAALEQAIHALLAPDS